MRFADLKKIGVVLKRAQYFITCGGRMLFPIKLEEDFITRNLLSDGGRKAGKEEFPAGEAGITYRQLSLFDDMEFGGMQWKQMKS